MLSKYQTRLERVRSERKKAVRRSYYDNTRSVVDNVTSHEKQIKQIKQQQQQNQKDRTIFVYRLGLSIKRLEDMIKQLKHEIKINYEDDEYDDDIEESFMIRNCNSKMEETVKELKDVLEKRYDKIKYIPDTDDGHRKQKKPIYSYNDRCECEENSDDDDDDDDKIDLSDDNDKNSQKRPLRSDVLDVDNQSDYGVDRQNKTPTKNDTEDNDDDENEDGVDADDKDNNTNNMEQKTTTTIPTASQEKSNNAKHLFAFVISFLEDPTTQSFIMDIPKVKETLSFIKNMMRQGMDVFGFENYKSLVMNVILNFDKEKVMKMCTHFFNWIEQEEGGDHKKGQTKQAKQQPTKNEKDKKDLKKDVLLDILSKKAAFNITEMLNYANNKEKENTVPTSPLSTVVHHVRQMAGLANVETSSQQQPQQQQTSTKENKDTKTSQQQTATKENKETKTLQEQQQPVAENNTMKKEKEDMSNRVNSHADVCKCLPWCSQHCSKHPRQGFYQCECDRYYNTLNGRSNDTGSNDKISNDKPLIETTHQLASRDDILKNPSVLKDVPKHDEKNKSDQSPSKTDSTLQSPVLLEYIKMITKISHTPAPILHGQPNDKMAKLITTISHTPIPTPTPILHDQPNDKMAIKQDKAVVYPPIAASNDKAAGHPRIAAVNGGYCCTSCGKDLGMNTNARCAQCDNDDDDDDDSDYY